MKLIILWSPDSLDLKPETMNMIAQFKSRRVLYSQRQAEIDMDIMVAIVKQNESNFDTLKPLLKHGSTVAKIHAARMFTIRNDHASSARTYLLIARESRG